MLPRGIDGLFFTPGEGVEVLALVLRGSAEEAWMRRVLSPSRCLSYDLDVDLGPYPRTDALLEASSIGSVLSSRGVKALLLSAACSPATHAWALRYGIELWMVDYEEQRRLEDKIWFDAFLTRHGLGAPRSGVVVAGPTMTVPRRSVLQARESLGGEGTYFVDGTQAARALVRDGRLLAGERYLRRAFVRGVPYGITLFVAPSRVSLSAIRRQCYYPRTGASPVFAGVQWLPSSRMSHRLRRRLDDVFLRMGEVLHQRRTFGFANVDFIVDPAERVWILECNPRMSAATPQLFHVPGLLAGDELGASFAAGFTRRRRFSSRFARDPIPDTTYEGATLDIVSPAGGLVRRTWRSGVYRFTEAGARYLAPDPRSLAGHTDLCLVSFARKGQRAAENDSLAGVVSQAALYDERGELSLLGQRVSSFFRYQ
jgi:hypothetical protein